MFMWQKKYFINKILSYVQYTQEQHENDNSYKKKWYFEYLKKTCSMIFLKMYYIMLFCLKILIK